MVQVLIRELKGYPAFSGGASKFYHHCEDSHEKEYLYAHREREHILILCVNKAFEIYQQNTGDADQKDLSEQVAYL